jgi:hypothetical protein
MNCKRCGVETEDLALDPNENEDLVCHPCAVEMDRLQDYGWLPPGEFPTDKELQWEELKEDRT